MCVASGRHFLCTTVNSYTDGGEERSVQKSAVFRCERRDGFRPFSLFQMDIRASGENENPKNAVFPWVCGGDSGT